MESKQEAGKSPEKIKAASYREEIRNLLDLTNDSDLKFLVQIYTIMKTYFRKESERRRALGKNTSSCI